MENITTNNHHFEPIYKSAIVLLTQLFFMMLLIDTAYAIFFILFPLYILSLTSPLTMAILIVVFIIKYIVQMILIFRITLVWANEVFHVNGQHIICRRGILNITEKVYECKNIRSVSVYQSVFGRIFNYGDLKLRVSASGGYNEEFLIPSVADPKRYEVVLEQLLQLY